jgi:predicted Rossmann fold nucleotide-binding protein DprA/Smf involved in DNA uptake
LSLAPSGRLSSSGDREEEVAELHAEDPEDGPDPPPPEPDATDDQLLRLLAGRGSVDPSELCVRLELPIGETIARLTRLELRGDVRLTAAGYAAARADPSR